MDASVSVPALSCFDGLTADNFNGVLTTVGNLVPLVLGAMLGFIALRKGIRFIKSAIAGA